MPKSLVTGVLLAIALGWFAIVYVLTYPRLPSGIGSATLPALPTGMSPNASWFALPFAMLFLIAAYGLGRRLLRHADIPWTQPWQRDLVAPVVGFVVLGMALLLLGATDLFGRAPTIGLWLLALAFGWPEIRELPQRCRGTLAAVRESLQVVVPGACLALLALFGVLGAIVAVAPETAPDALHEHLFAVSRYAAAGRFIALPFYEMTHLPELAHVSWIPLWHLLTDVGPKAIVFLQGGLLVLLSAAIAFELAGRRAAWLAALITASTPALLSSSTQATPDIQLALFASFAFWIAVRFGHAKHGALLAGVLAGAGAATKYAGAPLVLITAVLVARASSASGWRSVFARAALARASHALAGAALVVGPFYLKNWIVVGSPVYPLLASQLGSYAFTANEVETHLALTTTSGFKRNLASVLLLPWDMTVSGEAFGGCLGALLLSCAALVPLALGERTARRLGLALLMFLGALALGRHDVRWALPAVPLLASLIGCAVERIRELELVGRIAAPAFTAIVLATAVLHLPFFSNVWLEDTCAYQPRQIPLDVVAGGERRSHYLTRLFPGYAIAAHYNTKRPENRLLTLPEWERGLPPVWLGSALVRNNAALRLWRVALANPAPDAIYAMLRENGITHLVVRRDAEDARVKLIDDESAFGRRYLKQMDARGPYALFALERSPSVHALPVGSEQTTHATSPDG